LFGVDREQVSDARGQVRFTDLSTGTYVLSVFAEGYLGDSVEVTVGTGESQYEVSLVAYVFARVTAASGNLRQGPGTDYTRQGTVQQGDLLQIVGVSEDGEWLVVATGEGTSAWLWSDLCAIEGSLHRVEVVCTPPTPTPEPG
jgi:hypothetical protein